jgi:hypothetical protein
MAVGNGTEPAANSRQDDELTELLAKLYGIQEDIGAKPPSTEEERKAKAQHVAIMGKGKKAAAKGSRFLELKTTILNRLKNIASLLKEAKNKEAAGYGGDNAKEIIKMQAEIREQIRQAQDEWSEMDAIYKKEARKKKSKFTPEELEVQAELVRRLSAEIEKVKEAQMRGYAKNRDAGTAVSLNTKALYADTGMSFVVNTHYPSSKNYAYSFCILSQQASPVARAHPGRALHREVVVPLSRTININKYYNSKNAMRILIDSSMKLERAFKIWPKSPHNKARKSNVNPPC